MRRRRRQRGAGRGGVGKERSGRPVSTSVSVSAPALYPSVSPELTPITISRDRSPVESVPVPSLFVVVSHRLLTIVPPPDVSEHDPKNQNHSITRSDTRTERGKHGNNYPVYKAPPSATSLKKAVFFVYNGL